MRLLFFLMVFLTTAHAKPLVVTTFSIVEDIVHEIGQDKIEVKTLVGPNQDSHVYQPRPQDGKDLSQADLVVVNGLGFEGWLDRLIDASGFHGKILVATKGIHPLTYQVHGSNFVDPHAWHSLQNGRIYVDNIVRGLSELLPQDASFFKTRGDAYKKSLTDLEKKMQEKFKVIPKGARKIITNHNAFDYLGREFGLTFISPQGLRTEAQPSAKALARLINQIRQENIQAIFIENISNPRLIEQISEETQVQIGGLLYSDALSSKGEAGDTYLKMMTFNLDALHKSLEKKKSKAKASHD